MRSARRRGKTWAARGGSVCARCTGGVGEGAGVCEVGRNGFMIGWDGCRCGCTGRDAPALHTGRLVVAIVAQGRVRCNGFARRQFRNPCVLRQLPVHPAQYPAREPCGHSRWRRVRLFATLCLWAGLRAAVGYVPRVARHQPLTSRRSTAFCHSSKWNHLSLRIFRTPFQPDFKTRLPNTVFPHDEE